MSWGAGFDVIDRNSEWSNVKVALAHEVHAKTGGRCFYCGTYGANTIDHFHPYSKGGTDRLCNLVPACHPCNCSKGPRSMDEWRFSLRFKLAREEYGVPVMSFAAVEWLTERGFDIFEGVPEKVFWFEEQGFDQPRKYDLMPAQYLEQTFGGAS